MLILLLALGCGGSEPAAPASTGAPGAPASAAAPVAPVSAFDAKAFACCDSPEAQAVVDAYLRAQAALAKDDAAGAQAAAKALADKADALAKTAPERDRPWLATIATGARALGGQDLVAARESFKAVSNASLDYARAHTGGATRVAKAYCPMADASWLQREPIVSNPYYGAEMPTCGSFP